MEEQFHLCVPFDAHLLYISCIYQHSIVKFYRYMDTTSREDIPDHIDGKLELNSEHAFHKQAKKFVK